MIFTFLLLRLQAKEKLTSEDQVRIPEKLKKKKKKLDNFESVIKHK